MEPAWALGEHWCNATLPPAFDLSETPFLLSTCKLGFDMHQLPLFEAGVHGPLRRFVDFMRAFSNTVEGHAPTQTRTSGKGNTA